MNFYKARRVDEWQFENRLLSRVAAIREIIRRGIITDEFAYPPDDAASGEFRVVDDAIN